MAYIEMEFPGDMQDERVRSGRNINDVEKWLSVAAEIGRAHV